MNTKDAARVRELQHDPRGVLDLRLAPRVLGIGDRVCADAHDDVAKAMPARSVGPLRSTATTNDPSPCGGGAVDTLSHARATYPVAFGADATVCT
jgi:hypothetical protein